MGDNATADDDFGDLYADVEVQASSAINSLIPNSFTSLCTEQEEVEDDNNENKKKKMKNDNMKVEELRQRLESTEADDGSDSDDDEDDDDDLNIVLNDEDCNKGFLDVNVKRGGGFGEDDGDRDNDVEGDEDGGKNELGSTGLEPSERGNGVKGGYYNANQYCQYKNVRPYASCSYKSVRGEWGDQRRKQPKVLNSGQIANVRAAANSVTYYGGHGFSLPWYRTILDVNIDTFEEKRWMYPGVDVSDFFNFGFNEESWRQYCISVEQFRQQFYLHSRIPAYESGKLTQAYNFGYEHERVAQGFMPGETSLVRSSSKSTNGGVKPVGLPKGRAIKVEDGLGERQPTLDLRRPRTWDSDVVIQINLQDPGENSPVFSKEELGHMDSSTHEASKSRDLNVDKAGDTHHSGKSRRDEFSAESPGGNARDSLVKRCSQPMSGSNQVSPNSDSYKNDQVSDEDTDNHKVTTQTVEDFAEVMDTAEKEEEIGKNLSKPDQCTIETELSDERSHFSISPSCSGSFSDASGDYSDPKESSSPLRTPSSSGIHESFTHDRISQRNNGVVTKAYNSQDFPRNRSPDCERQENQNRRLHRLPERRIHADNGDDASPITRDLSSTACCGRTERLNDFDREKRKDFSYYRQRDLSCGYSGDRFGDNHVQAGYKCHSHTRHHQSFRDVIKPQKSRNWNEEEYFNKRNFRSYNRDNLDREIYDYVTGLSPGDKAFTYTESRQLESRYKFEERDTQWRRKSDKVQFGKRMNHDSYWISHKNRDELIEEKYGRYVPFTNRKRDLLDEKYEGHSLLIEREVNLSRRKGRYRTSPPISFDDLQWPEIEDAYWDRDRSLSPQNHRESYRAYARCQVVMSPKSDLSDFRLTERYGRRHRRRICDEEGRGSGWIDSENYSANIEDVNIYPGDKVHSGSRMNDWESRVPHQTKCESMLTCRDYGFHSQQISPSYGKTLRHESMHRKYISCHSGMIVDDMQLEQRRYKRIQEGYSGNGVNRRNSRMCKGKHEQAVTRCSDSVASIVSEGKSFGRSSCGGSNCEFEKVDPKIAKKQTVLKDFITSQTDKESRTDIPKIEANQVDEKLLDKFSIIEHNKDSDIEEGQIITEEPNTEDIMGKKCVSEFGVLMQNVKKRIFHGENASARNARYDNQRILETLAKMEKRRERFKDPVAVKKVIDKATISQDDQMVNAVEIKQERPARKRRWGGG